VSFSRELQQIVDFDYARVVDSTFLTTHPLNTITWPKMGPWPIFLRKMEI
jgi:hypothetical protein